MTGGGHSIITHPALQSLGVASSVSALTQGSWVAWLAVPGAIYYAVLLVRELISFWKGVSNP